MRRGGLPVWTVDWPDRPPPEVGEVFLRLTPTSQSSFWRIEGVRVVKHRKALRNGYTARFRIEVSFVSDDGAGIEPAWTLHCYSRERTPKTDKFSPLL